MWNENNGCMLFDTMYFVRRGSKEQYQQSLRKERVQCVYWLKCKTSELHSTRLLPTQRNRAEVEHEATLQGTGKRGSLFPSLKET